MNSLFRLIWLAVGAFAIGTEGYVVAGLLPDLAGDLHVSIGERISVARRPEILGALSVTVFALAGVYAVYSYLAPLLDRVAHVGGDQIAMMLFRFGVGGVLGNLSSGATTDRIGSKRVITFVLLGLAVLFSLLALVSAWLPPSIARWVLVPLLALWGFVGFSFPASQQAFLVSLAPKFAPITLSLNSSAIYLGVSLGCALGSLFVARGGIGDLGWVGAGCEVIAFFVLRFGPRRRRVADEEATGAMEPHVTELA